MRINTNISSLNAQRQLANTTSSLNKTMERLSSGLRINRAGDDAAGLAISENFKADIAALEQSSRNAGDGVSMVQIAEGSLDEVSSILIRLRELAQEASTETLGATERGYLDTEYQTLLTEITRISDSAQFNGTNLLDGSAGTLSVQVGLGTGAGDQIDIDLTADVDATGLGLAATDLTGADNTNPLAAISAIETAIDTVSGERASLGAAQNRLESTMRSIANSIENMSAANSRIRDADIATESANLASQQVLQQAGISVLSQANMTPSYALQLLQG